MAATTPVDRPVGPAVILRRERRRARKSLARFIASGAQGVQRVREVVTRYAVPVLYRRWALVEKKGRRKTFRYVQLRDLRVVGEKVFPIKRWRKADD